MSERKLESESLPDGKSPAGEPGLDEHASGVLDSEVSDAQEKHLDSTSPTPRRRRSPAR